VTLCEITEYIVNLFAYLISLKLEFVGNSLKVFPVWLMYNNFNFVRNASSKVCYLLHLLHKG